MDRKEFCEIMSNAKVTNKLSWFDLMIATQTHERVLQKVFGGETNFFLETALSLLPSLKLYLFVVKGNNFHCFESAKDAQKWIGEARTISISKLAELTGVSCVALSTNLSGNSRMRIDTFLKSIKALNGEVFLVTINEWELIRLKRQI